MTACSFGFDLNRLAHFQLHISRLEGTGHVHTFLAKKHNR